MLTAGRGSGRGVQAGPGTRVHVWEIGPPPQGGGGGWGRGLACSSDGGTWRRVPFRYLARASVASLSSSLLSTDSLDLPGGVSIGGLEVDPAKGTPVITFSRAVISPHRYGAGWEGGSPEEEAGRRVTVPVGVVGVDVSPAGLFSSLGGDTLSASLLPGSPPGNDAISASPRARLLIADAVISPILSHSTPLTYPLSPFFFLLMQRLSLPFQIIFADSARVAEPVIHDPVTSPNTIH